MSGESDTLGGKSSIPVLKPAPKKEEIRSENPDRKNLKWTDKLKRRSASTLSLFNVTHKVPSHIVAPKSPVKETLKYPAEDGPTACQPPFHRSNMELSNCWWGQELAGASAASGDQHDREVQSHSKDALCRSEQDLVSAWWHRTLLPPNQANFQDSDQKSASITNIFDESEDFMLNSSYFDMSKDPISLPASHYLNEDYNRSCQDLPKVASHDHPAIPSFNGGLRSQFRSEQNLFNSNNPLSYESDIHSLDYSYGFKSMSKFNFDISTIKELPEDRSDSPIKQYNRSDSAPQPCATDYTAKPISKRPSIAEKYRSLQDLRQSYGDNQSPLSLTASQSNILFQTIPEDEIQDFTSPYISSEDRNCFRSIQDLREVPIIEAENYQYSLDYHMLNNNNFTSVQDLSKESTNKLKSFSTNFNGNLFSDRDISVSMVDIGNASVCGDDMNYSSLMKLEPAGSSKIPKRRHTLTEHELTGVFPNLSKTHGKSFSSHNLNSLPDAKQSSDVHERAKSADKESSNNNGGNKLGGSTERTSSLDRKKGCVGCQHKRDRKPVVRQHSMPQTKVKLNYL